MKTFRMLDFELLYLHWDNDGSFHLSICEWETAENSGYFLFLLCSKGRTKYVDILCIRKLWEQWRDK